MFFRVREKVKILSGNKGIKTKLNFRVNPELTQLKINGFN